MASTTSVLYSNSLEYPTNSLKPLTVSISFLGSLPPSLQPQSIPLQISVSLPEEYALYTTPEIVVEDNDNASISCLCSDEDDSDPEATFLPLPSTFDYQNREHWCKLASNIQEWLLDVIVDRRRPEWNWGCEAFWIAFTTAFPSFPAGDWSLSNPKIPVEGSFIAAWLNGERVDLVQGSHESEAARMASIWCEFQQLVVPFYSRALICSS